MNTIIDNIFLYFIDWKVTNLETLENVALEESMGKVCESIRFELAASFGKLTSESIKMMDRDLLVRFYIKYIKNNSRIYPTPPHKQDVTPS